MQVQTRPERHVLSFRQRFSEGSPDECWEWQGSIANSGYGQLSFGGTAHRFSFAYYVGPIPDGLHVLHRCDNRKCVNPRHLFLGTNLDNIRDMQAKGRNSGPLGERSSLAVLTYVEVKEIRKRYRRESHNVSNVRQLATEFGVSRDCIHEIVSGKNWKHLL